MKYNTINGKIRHAHKPIGVSVRMGCGEYKDTSCEHCGYINCCCVEPPAAPPRVQKYRRLHPGETYTYSFGWKVTNRSPITLMIKLP